MMNTPSAQFAGNLIGKYLMRKSFFASHRVPSMNYAHTRTLMQVIDVISLQCGRYIYRFYNPGPVHDYCRTS